mgnify:CR=1 FL=1
MIYINLLPVKEIKNKIVAKRQIYFSLISIVTVFIMVSIFIWFQSSTISKLLFEEKRIEQEKNQYTKILNQIKKIDEEIKILENRISVIKNLKKESSITVHVLDEIANSTPNKRMWIKSIDQNYNKLNLTGMALDDQTIASYMDELDKSKYISAIILSKTTMEKFAERNLKSFSISCTVGIEHSDKN